MDDNLPSSLQDLFVSQRVDKTEFQTGVDAYFNTKCQTNIKTLASESSLSADYKVVQFFELDDVALGHTHLMRPYTTGKTLHKRSNIIQHIKPYMIRQTFYNISNII